MTTTKQFEVQNGMKEINSKLAIAVVPAIIEMPTFKDSKIEFAPEYENGMFCLSFTKSERLDIDCYGNVSEMETYEIRLYEVLGGNDLLTVYVENGECLIDDEKVELQNVSAAAVEAMITFIHGEGDYYDGACEEVAFSSKADVLFTYERLILEWTAVYKMLMHGKLTDDERVVHIERYLELSDQIDELRKLVVL
ncbi:hypothetical protein [Lysinibacillus fusiformis]